MATKKKPEVSEEELEQEVPGEAEEKPAKKDKWAQMETVTTPRKQKHDYYYVCVNDRRFEIPADGKPHEMPLPIAEVLQQTIEAEYAAQDFAEGLPNRGEPNQK